MECPYCAGDSSVSETRDSPDGVRRRRLCNICKRRFTTYERVGSVGLKLQKRDGTAEPFMAQKLATAIRRVTKYRPLRAELIDRIVREIEATLVDDGQRMVHWHELAARVIDRLATVDRLARDRFAANYLDEAGQLRLEASVEPSLSDPAQLGLPGVDDPAKP